jgi:hypothetical protein
MEIAMIRTALRHTVIALAAVAFSLTLIGQAAAGDRQQTPQLHPSQLQWAPIIQPRPGSPEGLATLKPRQGTTQHNEWRWFQDYSGGK